MKLKDEIPTVYLEEYDINVKQYLTYSQIQTIINDTEALMQHIETDEEKGTQRVTNTWAERQTNIDMLLMLFATDIDPDELGKFGHVALLQNGVIDAVKDKIINYWQIEEAFKYTESWDKVLINVVKQLSNILQQYGEKAAIKELVNRDELPQ